MRKLAPLILLFAIMALVRCQTIKDVIEPELSEMAKTRIEYVKLGDRIATAKADIGRLSGKQLFTNAEWNELLRSDIAMKQADNQVNAMLAQWKATGSKPDHIDDQLGIMQNELGVFRMYITAAEGREVTP